MTIVITIVSKPDGTFYAMKHTTGDENNKETSEQIISLLKEAIEDEIRDMQQTKK
jgi:hypothetical protein